MSKMKFKAFVAGQQRPGFEYDVLGIIHEPQMAESAICVKVARTLTEVLGHPAEWPIINMIAGYPGEGGVNTAPLMAVKLFLEVNAVDADDKLMLVYQAPHASLPRDGGRLRINVSDRVHQHFMIPPDGLEATMHAIVLTLQEYTLSLRYPADYIIATAEYIRLSNEKDN